MRFMMTFRGTEEYENGAMPSEESITAMTALMAEMAAQGVLLSGDGLHPSSKAVRLELREGKQRVVDGPFTETKELIAGYWLFRTQSLQEAIEWVKRAPNPGDGQSEIEIRQIFDAEDFGAEFTPELRAQEDRLRDQLEAQS